MCRLSTQLDLARREAVKRGGGSVGRRDVAVEERLGEAIGCYRVRQAKHRLDEGSIKASAQLLPLYCTLLLRLMVE